MKKQKLLSTKELARKALTNRPRAKPAKGYVHLATIKPGELFETEFGTRGILLECDVNAKVLIDMNKTTISAYTEVKVIRAEQLRKLNK